jgi:hypothetical protein
MPSYLLNYNLQNGFIHNWLVAGPVLSELSLEQVETIGTDESIYPELSTIKGSGLSIPPVDLGSLGDHPDPLSQVYWRYFACDDDHFVNLSRFLSTPKFLQSWGYCRLAVPTRQRVRVQLAMKGFAELWVNNQPIPLVYKKTSRLLLGEADIELSQGDNQFLFRHYQVGVGELVSLIALRLPGIHPETQVSIPVELERDQYQKRIDLEKVADAAYLDQYVFGYMNGDQYDRNEQLLLRFSNDLEERGQLSFRMQGLNGSIFQEMTQHSAAGLEFELAKIFPLRSGLHHLAISPIAGDYYQKKVQFQRKDNFYIVRSGYSMKGGKKNKEHLIEALNDAGKRRNESVFCEISKMALDQWDKIHWEYVRSAVDRVNHAEENSIFDMIGLLGIAGRFWKKRQLPDDLIQAIPDAILDYAFSGQGEAVIAINFITGGRDILFLVCEYLAGELYPDHIFTWSSQTGNQHRTESGIKISRWIQDSFSYGFREWNSPQVFERVLTALSHLVDLGKDLTIREMAIVLMDKIFFYLALNTVNGAFGSTHGSSDTASILSTRLSPVSGMTRLMWGIGNYNDHVMGVVSLGCCKKYRLPVIIRKLATEPPPVLWNLERHAIPPQNGPSSHPRIPGVHTATYRTNDFMLSSAQDYAPGAPGQREHIWQATLGPDAVVFVNHPFIANEMDTPEPNLWLGNHVLPKVVQWGDLLIAFHQTPDDWLGYTHAYFPQTKFDEHDFQGNWAFARKGNGYIALSALNGFEVIKSGRTAFRELRAQGKNQVWICQMGQAILDGDFENFKGKIISMKCSFTEGLLSLRSIRGDHIRCGWEGAFFVNDQESALRWEKHIQNPFCIADHPATQLEILDQKNGLRLSI